MLIALHPATFALRLAIANMCSLYTVGFRHELACSFDVKKSYWIQDWTFAIRERVRTGKALDRETVAAVLERVVPSSCCR